MIEPNFMRLIGLMIVIQAIFMIWIYLSSRYRISIKLKEMQDLLVQFFLFVMLPSALILIALETVNAYYLNGALTSFEDIFASALPLTISLYKYQQIHSWDPVIDPFNKVFFVKLRVMGPEKRRELAEEIRKILEENPKSESP
jgi:hypothetical protein